MKLMRILSLCVLLVFANANQKGEQMRDEIYLAGGCFWGMQGYFDKIFGVIETSVGYANGISESADYHGLKQSKHAETMHIVFDANRINLAEILLHFFRVIDPTSLNRQGNDIGTQYRTGIYYTNPAHEKIARLSLKILQEDHQKPLAIELEPLRHYILAEEYHQKYLDKNPGGYCHINLNLAHEPLFKAKFSLTQKELKDKLNDISYAVTQQNATERPFTSEFDKFNEKGIYIDITSGVPLFSSKDKFDAGCGWPSFYKPITTDALKYLADKSHGMNRTEVRSSTADAHLGHVFDDAPLQNGGLRYCINGAALEFIPVDKMRELGYKKLLPFVE
ncbi:peptide-methionine (R)-S-oxide reductase MsrB [Campylobacter majalis]|uniref:peptide-methionine (R)-S-oxide reductase MsrB n=1 Tax=Campylobacter majalis TaxID=2790656 RepID=UPI003D68B0C3